MSNDPATQIGVKPRGYHGWFMARRSEISDAWKFDLDQLTTFTLDLEGARALRRLCADVIEQMGIEQMEAR